MNCKIYPTESQEQQALFEWARLKSKQRPELNWLFHVPNGGARNTITGARLKAEGVKQGVPDIILPAARGNYHALAIELKRRKDAKSQVSEVQYKWLDYLTCAKWSVSVCYGAEDAMQTIEEYLNLPVR